MGTESRGYGRHAILLNAGVPTSASRGDGTGLCRMNRPTTLNRNTKAATTVLGVLIAATADRTPRYVGSMGGLVFSRQLL